jgi:hypothetical protein
VISRKGKQGIVLDICSKTWFNRTLINNNFMVKIGAEKSAETITISNPALMVVTELVANYDLDVENRTNVDDISLHDFQNVLQWIAGQAGMEIQKWGSVSAVVAEDLLLKPVFLEILTVLTNLQQGGGDLTGISEEKMIAALQWLAGHKGLGITVKVHKNHEEEGEIVDDTVEDYHAELGIVAFDAIDEIKNHLKRFESEYQELSAGVQERCSWEQVDNRLRGNNFFYLEKVLEMEGGGLLFGVDLQGNPLFIDNGSKPYLGENKKGLTFQEAQAYTEEPYEMIEMVVNGEGEYPTEWQQLNDLLEVLEDEFGFERDDFAFWGDKSEGVVLLFEGSSVMSFVLCDKSSREWNYNNYRIINGARRMLRVPAA